MRAGPEQHQNVSLCDLRMPKVTEEMIAHNVAVLREYYRERRETLKEVAYTALEADGRTGWSGSLGVAYQRGVWDLWTKENQLNLSLDLRSGELRVATSFTYGGDSWFDVAGIAPDAEVAKLAANPLDVDDLLGKLKEMARTPYASYYRPEEQEARKAGYRAKLDEIFSRA